MRLCTQRGFVFPSSEIYGGLAGAWDYGPLGVYVIALQSGVVDDVQRRRRAAEEDAHGPLVARLCGAPPRLPRPGHARDPEPSRHAPSPRLRAQAMQPWLQR